MASIINILHFSDNSEIDHSKNKMDFIPLFIFRNLSNCKLSRNHKIVKF